jgi:sterol desaturase/sphingolipid hydroxylase (fatty acid hydroxylase superfamily)
LYRCRSNRLKNWNFFCRRCAERLKAELPDSYQYGGTWKRLKTSAFANPTAPKSGRLKIINTPPKLSLELRYTPAMDLIFMALPVFAFLIVAEVVFTSLQGGGVYALKDFAGSMSQLGINSVVRLGTGGALIGLHFFLYQFRVFDVPNTVWGWIFTFVVIDFVFYWYHRGQHRVRFMWCAHVVHHSSEHMNLGTALRQSPTGPFTRALFYWPLPLLGFTRCW